MFNVIKWIIGTIKIIISAITSNKEWIWNISLFFHRRILRHLSLSCIVTYHLRLYEFIHQIIFYNKVDGIKFKNHRVRYFAKQSWLGLFYQVRNKFSWQHFLERKTSERTKVSHITKWRLVGTSERPLIFL